MLTPWPDDRERPWPLEIEPGAAPGGLVFRVYAVDGGVMLHEDRVSDETFTTDPGSLRSGATDARRAAVEHDGETCLVVYDGDTGQRITVTSDLLA